MRQRHWIVALLSVLMVLLTPAPAQADQGCVITVGGIKVCGELLGQPLPEVITVTVKPDPVKLPGATITLPPQVQTQTVTVPAQPNDTVTVTVQPETVRSTTESVPNGTTPVNPSEGTRQAPSPSATIGSSPPVSNDGGGSQIDFGDGETTIIEAGIGLLTLLALVGLLLIAMWAGYVLGYKDKERKDTNFMRALLDSVKSRQQ